MPETDTTPDDTIHDALSDAPESDAKDVEEEKDGETAADAPAETSDAPSEPELSPAPDAPSGGGDAQGIDPALTEPAAAEEGPAPAAEGGEGEDDAGAPAPEQPAADLPPTPDLGTQAPPPASSEEGPKDDAEPAPTDAIGGTEAQPEEAPKGEDKADEASDSDKEKEEPTVPFETDHVDLGASGGSATPPTSVEGGDKPGPIAGVGDTVASPGVPSVKIGDDHVAQGVDQQTISSALASAAARGVSLAGYLQEQGINAIAAPGLTEHVDEQHGKGATKTHREWSVVIREFYSQDS